MCTSSLGTITGHQNLELGPFFAFVIIIQWHWKKLNIMKTLLKIHFSCCHCCQSVTSDHMNFSAPGFPVLHHRLELAQTHAHQVGDATQPSHPLSSPSPPDLNLSQHESLFQMSQLFTSGGQSIYNSLYNFNIYHLLYILPQRV